MVDSVNRDGLFDWLVQRCTAIVIGLYTVFLILYFLIHPLVVYADWQTLFLNGWMRIATVIVLVSVLWHAWIGLWTVFTDYIKIKLLRLLLELLVLLLLLAYFVWLLEILWR